MDSITDQTKGVTPAYRDTDSTCTFVSLLSLASFRHNRAISATSIRTNAGTGFCEGVGTFHGPAKVEDDA